MTRLQERWRIISAAPHRLFFWSGALYAVVAMAVWVLQQASLYTPWLPAYAWSLPQGPAHGFMMIHGLFGFYFFGFLLTTFPRWLDTEPVPRSAYVTAWLLLFTGGHLFWVGLHTWRGLSLAGSLLVLLSYGVVTVQCVGVLRRTANPHRVQQWFICAGLIGGMAANAVAAWAFAAPAAERFALARTLGLYLFLLPVIFTVVYRMVPFFASAVTPRGELRRSSWALHWFTAFLLLRAALTLLDALAWYWVADAGLFLVLAREMVVWRFWRSPHVPLLTVLYVALGWFLLSFVLSGSESLLALVQQLRFQPFQQAALHALTVGGFGSFLVGISTRVTLGHSGRGLGTNLFMAVLFYGFQLVPLMRVTPDVAAFFFPTLAGQGFWAGVPWILAFGLWLLIIGPVLTRPRSDGRPG